MSNKVRLDRPPVEPEPAPAPTEDRSTAVTVGYVHEYTLDYSFFHSFVGMLGYDAERAGRVWRGGFIGRRGTTGDLAAGRNGVVKDFLAEQRADWLWWIDTDMGFDPDVIERLFEVADPVERPVVGAMCFAQREHEMDGMGGSRPVAWPVLLDWTFIDERGGFEVRWDYPRETVTRCHGTGSACLLVHRSVFERMRDEYGGGPEWDAWYSRVTNPTTGELVGEDLSFCMRLMRLEVPVHVHTGIATTHAKRIWLGERDYWAQRALSAPPETTEPLPRERWQVPRFAVVPTHNRPQRLLALVSSLSRQCDHVVVLDNACEPPVDAALLRVAAGDADVTVLRDEEQPPNLSRFWNVMFDHCAAHAETLDAKAWDVGVFNDDAIVPAGWFDVCSTVLRGHETAAVAHTGTSPVHRHELITEFPYPREKRMCPWAFLVKGELGLRADEELRWFYGDDDFCRAAIDAGGVLAAPGPLAINALAVQATVQSAVLAEQAMRDRETFEKKWTER
jgi:hypothetical protein